MPIESVKRPTYPRPVRPVAPLKPAEPGPRPVEPRPVRVELIEWSCDYSNSISDWIMNVFRAIQEDGWFDPDLDYENKLHPSQAADWQKYDEFVASCQKENVDDIERQIRDLQEKVRYINSLRG